MLEDLTGLGSIPALAGEPIQGVKGDKGDQVYPRACGGTAEDTQLQENWRGLSPRLRGNIPLHPLDSLDSGLSPRLRGNPSRHRRSVSVWRSIPALAGEPAGLSGWRRGSAVYPRACGGTVGLAAGVEGVHGLSPRLRGNPYRTAQAIVEQRSIPALAGEPAAHRSGYDAATVYPRACGGTNWRQ